MSHPFTRPHMTHYQFDNLETAIMNASKAAEAYAYTEDGGTCNFDSPAIRVKATARQMAMLDFSVTKWGRRLPDGSTWYVINMPLSGQGNRRSRMAEAAADSLRAQGYEACVCYQMD